MFIVVYLTLFVSLKSLTVQQKYRTLYLYQRDVPYFVYRGISWYSELQFSSRMSMQHYRSCRDELNYRIKETNTPVSVTKPKNLLA
jgi:hypothetical protein